MARTKKKQKPGTRAPGRRAAEKGSEHASTRSASFPIVVVGASAGGLDAMKKLLGAMPADSGNAIVLVPHLDPRHESLMAELLAKQTTLAVHEARHGETIRPNEVYVIPPNRYLAIRDGRLELSEPPPARGLLTAIDFALSSAARDQQDAAIGVILSGTGAHGVLGVKEIKLAGGIVLVQAPETAEFDQMPQNALATGVVDYVLPPEKMPEVLARLARSRAQSAPLETEPTDGELDGVRRVLAILQAQTKHNFRQYRKSMVARRARRRMTLLQIEDWTGYVAYLRDHADEVDALFKDLLIGVTEFFRDAAAFKALAERIVTTLVERATPEHPVRVWVPGCASGEEAYSLAMLLIERFRALDQAPSLQIFATDVNEGSLDIARQGVYPETIAATISPERLKRFFIKVDAYHYQVSKQLRDSIVFASQNLITDAPFSKLDLISCRNVLIYLEPNVQEKVISLLHFALNDDGFLFLGPSESIGRASGMFEPIVKKWRMFRRIGPARRDLVTIPIAAGEPRRTAEPAPERSRRASAGFGHLLQKVLIDNFAPASALINREFEILSVQGPLVNYLEFPPGEITKDILALARQGLRTRIRAACQAALRDGQTATERDARVRRNGGYTTCSVTVQPIGEPREAAGTLLVVFQDQAPSKPDESKRRRRAGREQAEDSTVAQLENELRATREDLQTTIEELESSNEELKASNEEIMSMNEELQSTNEELETSKEELQSLNEELATVNSQLQDKVEDLDAANSDLSNLMAATDIATVFLDTELKIKRFTPSTARLLNLLASDVGRPLGDLAPRFTDDALLADAERVLETLAPNEKPIHTGEAKWYLRRILPYRTRDNRIAGVVITFIDITARVAAEEQARRLATVVRDSNDALIVSAPDGQILEWNRGAERLYGYTEAEALRMNMLDITPKSQQGTVVAMAERVARGEEIDSFETKRLARDGRQLDIWVTLTALRDEGGVVVAIARTECDITSRRAAESEIRTLNAELEQRVEDRTSALSASEQRIRAILDATVDAIITIDSDGRIETFNKAAENMFGYSADEIRRKNVTMLMGSPYREHHDDYLKRYLTTHEPRLIGRLREFKARRKDGTQFPIQLSVNELGELGLFTGIVRDMTEQRELQEEIVRIATSEQRRIGQELHDNIQQELTGIALHAQNLADALGAQVLPAEHQLAVKLASDIALSNQRVRDLARGLIPVPVDAEGLMEALAALAERTDEQDGISCRFECSGPVHISDDMSALHLYRIAQEGVTNALKHAHADEISIHLELRDGQLRISVRDNGIGIDVQREQNNGLGLRIMEHRCGLLGGTITVRRRKRGGTIVSCRVPAPQGE